MSEINGYDNEYEFVQYLNGRSIGNLNPMFRELIEQLYYDLNDGYVISAWRNHSLQKSDIFIRINGIMKGISIKKEMKNSVHVDGISNFIHFLIENEVPREIVIAYLKYHYADGTTNGKGTKRISVEEYKKTHQDDIDKINEYFNTEEILNRAVERFIIKGNNSKYRIDALICGEVNDFVWLLPEDIRKIVLSKKDVYSTAVHFGPVTCQPKNRCLNYNSSYEKDRFCVQLKWYNLHDEIIEHMNNSILAK